MELFYFFKMFFINYVGVFMYLYELFDRVFFFLIMIFMGMYI